jgi:nitrate reductase NapAB chaperone NapD
MPIAGVVIVTAENEAEEALVKINAMENVTTYGIHKENNIVAVFEGESPKALERLNDKILKEVKGVLGVYPSYVNYEDE